MNAQRWKRNEREVALALGGIRIPNNGTGQPDVDHPLLAIQVKTVATWPAWLRIKWEQTVRDAETYHKAPVLVLCLAPGQGIKTERLALVPLELLGTLVEIATCQTDTTR